MSGSASSTSNDVHFRLDSKAGSGGNAEQTEEGSRGSFSLESLMNPCHCKTTGLCTCCRSGARGKDEADDVSDEMCGASCCQDGQSCSDGLFIEPCSVIAETTSSSKGGCCSGRKKQQKASFISPPDVTPYHATQSLMTLQEEDAIVSPPCHCGPNCSCPGCLNESEASKLGKEYMKENEDCPDKCLTCSACVYGLTRPSGIEAVDEWMEKDRQAKLPNLIKKVHNPSVNVQGVQGHAANSTAEEGHIPPRRTVQSSRPPLPPFQNAASFFSSHFLDASRREYFANQLRASQTESLYVNMTPDEENIESLGYGERRMGESDEDWQHRHGFYHLTPDAIKIFDSARRFKEERERHEEQEERLASIEEQDTHADSSLLSMSPALALEVSKLRRKAMLARKTSTDVSPSTSRVHQT
ncbi:hypothetical protein CBS101457_006457 [Exobasidium rhododendri]|nr:hypothetical protein CBS101457_006457 [Exobasidium rhododendri]